MSCSVLNPLRTEQWLSMLSSPGAMLLCVCARPTKPTYSYSAYQGVGGVSQAKTVTKVTSWGPSYFCKDERQVTSRILLGLGQYLEQ